MDRQESRDRELLEEVTRPPASEAELEDALTRPTPETVAAIADLGGDLLVLGAGGKMGPSLAGLAQRSLKVAGSPYRVLCASRFSTPGLAERLSAMGIEVLPGDLLEPGVLESLPEAPNVLLMAGAKFGTQGAPEKTWATNCYLPGRVAERFRESRIVALSTGNVYPLVPVSSGGATEETPPQPVGEYGWSCLGRERLLHYSSLRYGTPCLLVRLYYANDLRYGVLLDIARKVWRREPVDVTTGYLNAIWQGDANGVLLSAFPLCASPPAILNLAGPETLSVRRLAERFAELLGAPPPVFRGAEAETALLGNAGPCRTLFGEPRMPLDRLMEWTAHWVRTGGPTLDKPTHFEARDGVF